MTETVPAGRASRRLPTVVNLVNWSHESRSLRVMDVWKPPKTPLGLIHRENSPRDAAMEVVTLSSDERSAAISGRVKVSLWLKFNPIWWFFNDAEQNLAHAEWYNSDLPQWQRAVLWNLRNPLQNFRAFVAGVADKNYTVRGRSPVMTVQRNDLFAPETGWQWCVLAGGDLWFPRFFVSYSGKRVVWYFGHQPTGFWGAKFNLNL